MSSILEKIPRLRIKNIFVTKINIKAIWRQCANTPKDDPNKLMVRGPTTQIRFRVRRARPNDDSKILSFVRENALLAWPAPINVFPAKNKRVLLEDFVSRTLCQGHSLVAEQADGFKGWSSIRGLALNTCLCPWDAVVLQKWAKCINCAHFKKLMMLSAYCLQAPDLHNKYSVHNILQIVLIVPPDAPKAAQMAQILAKTSIQRGRDMGYPVMRFDVTSDLVNTTMKNLKLMKEWEFRYKFILKPEKILDSQNKISEEEIRDESNGVEQNIVVYTAFPKRETNSSNEVKKNKET